MRSALILLALGAAPCRGLVVPLSAARPAASLAGVELLRVGDGEKIDVGAALTQTAASEKTLLILLKPTILIQNEEEELNFPGLLDQLGR